MTDVIRRVSENLSEAYTLPAFLYTDASILEAERREIFSKTWQYVGHTSQVRGIGDYFTTEVADRPIIVIRGQDGVIRAFYNVCTHRASRLVEGEGNKKLFTCPYHAWSFHLDGSLNRAPNMEGVANFDAKDFCLKDVRLDIQESLMFVNLDWNAPPLRTVFSGLFEGLQKFDLSRFAKVRVKTTVSKSNWKVGIDNYLECDHCSIVHKSLVQRLDMDQYELQVHDYYTYQASPLKGVTGDYALGQGGRYYWLYPNMWLSFDPGPANLSIHKSIPIDHKTTKYEYTTFLLTDEMTQEEEELFKIDEMVREEDRVICEVVQQGLSTGAYQQGRFSLSEVCVHHFHRLIQDTLSDVLEERTMQSLSRNF